MEKGERKAVSLLEIFILVAAIFAFAYIIHEAFSDEVIVSASSDSTTKGNVFENVNTCIKSKDGKICQEYRESECDAECVDACIPTERNNVDECKIGTCFDPVEGTCQAGSPKKACEDFKGKWIDDPYGNVPECQKGCCLTGNKTFYTTERQCERKSELLGTDSQFTREIKNELMCLALSNYLDEGACVLPPDNPGEKNNCEFLTNDECKGKGGDFYSGFLCSNSALNTKCEKQKTAKCVEGKDELYWFDSCGNRENVYNANKVESWNNGTILLPENSCSILSKSDNLANQKTCGNCVSLLSSKCGEKTDEEYLADGTINFVCRDISCTDENGNRRENGESWCAYQSSIGTDTDKKGREKRATDIPGSRHFKKSCINGKIITEPCADYRGEICVESKGDIGSRKTFSQASCRVNMWQQCLIYNKDVKAKGKGAKESKKARDLNCTANTDCFLKKVNVDKGFRFNVCLPRYPPGFNLEDFGSSAEDICSYANQKCVVIYIKDITGWKCIENCDCESSKFTKEMNDFCMSLGDCGASVNTAGDITYNYKVKGAPKLVKNKKYNALLSKYAEPVPGKFALPGNLSGNEGVIGGIEPFQGGKVPNPNLGNFGMANMVSGAVGGLAAYAANKIGSIIAGELAKPAIGGITQGNIIEAYKFKILGFQPGKKIVEAVSPKIGEQIGGGVTKLSQATALQNAMYGIGIATSVFSLAMAMFGGGPRLMGNIIQSGLSLITSILPLISSAFGPFGAIAGILIMVVFKFLGIGKIKKVIVKFTCEPWQAPTGGEKCTECGKDGFPCSKYTCDTLGQTCTLVNKGSGNELCINANPNDTISPVINPLRNILNGTTFSYENITQNGYELVSSENDGCIKSYQKARFGISVNEAARCRMDSNHTGSFEDMEFNLGDSLFGYNHSMEFVIPDLASLGLEGYDPNRRANYKLYVRCQDYSGNVNDNEYTIGFCIRPGEDKEEPVIVARNPDIDYVAYNSTEQDLTIVTQEPSDCKWDISDKSYDKMANDMECDNSIEDQLQLGWACFAELPIGKNETDFYVRCKDQPWLSGTNESERNVMSKSYKFTLKRTPEKLNIYYLVPDGENLTFGTRPFSVKVEARTAGGYDGNAICFFRWGNQDIKFMKTGSDEHEQVFNAFNEGERTLSIKCTDKVGNVAEKKLRFNITLDETPPEASRVYTQSGELVVVTSENSECAYSISDCAFNFENGTAFYGDGLYHTGEIEQGRMQYIKCKDEFENMPAGCTVVVQQI